MKHACYDFKRAVALCVLALAASNACAAYPEKAIHLIVPYPPRGLTDAVARRDMQRATVSDIGNTCELAAQRAAASAV